MPDEIEYTYVKGKGWVPMYAGDPDKRWYVVFRVSPRSPWSNTVQIGVGFTLQEAERKLRQKLAWHRAEVDDGWEFKITDEYH